MISAKSSLRDSKEIINFSQVLQSQLISINSVKKEIMRNDL